MYVQISKNVNEITHSDMHNNTEIPHSDPVTQTYTLMTHKTPVVSYGVGARTLTKKEEQAMLIFGKKIFRRIYGPEYENREWKSRTDRELEEMSKGENVVKWIKGQRISWLGREERMEEDRMPKKIFIQELGRTRRRGRPRKGWKEEVERDLQVLGVRRWRELVADRKKWKDTVRQAKAHSGLQSQWKKKK